MLHSVNSPGALPAGFVFPGDLEPGLMLVTGPRGAGKTTWCMGLANQARLLGMDARGLVSPAVINGEKKVGIDLLDLASGERRRLADRRGEAVDDLDATGWQMVAETLEWGNALLESTRSFDLFILDELGPLEFEQGIGFTAGLHIADLHRDVPLFVVVRPSLLDAARQRWPWSTILDLAPTTSA